MHTHARASLVVGILVVLLSVAPQALALDIRVLPNGTVEFFSGNVLGDTTAQGGGYGDLQIGGSNSSPIRVVPAAENKTINIKTKDNKTEVELRQKSDKKQDKQEKKRDQKVVNPTPLPDELYLSPIPEENMQEETETERLEMKFPAKASRQQLDARKKQRDQKPELENTLPVEEPATIIDPFVETTNTSATPQPTGAKVDRATYQRQLFEQRQKRDDSVEVRTTDTPIPALQTLEIKSGNSAAKLQKGTEFNLDPETNLVTITTPSGQDKVLYHLPDQAIERMKAAGFIDEETPETQEAEVEVADDDRVFYVTKKVSQRKLFGLFNRNVNTRVKLDDETGEVSEEDEASGSFFGQVLDVFTL